MIARTVEVPGSDGFRGGLFVSDDHGLSPSAVAFRVSENVHLSPGVRYQNMNPRLGDTSLDIRSAILDLGLIWAF